MRRFLPAHFLFRNWKINREKEERIKSIGRYIAQRFRQRHIGRSWGHTTDYGGTGMYLESEACGSGD